MSSGAACLRPPHPYALLAGCQLRYDDSGCQRWRRLNVGNVAQHDSDKSIKKRTLNICINFGDKVRGGGRGRYTRGNRELDSIDRKWAHLPGKRDVMLITSNSCAISALTLLFLLLLLLLLKLLLLLLLLLILSFLSCRLLSRSALLCQRLTLLRSLSVSFWLTFSYSLSLSLCLTASEC